ncbi:MAG: hypothetical protein GEU81_00910 [Nitriliruptorales bacterium]|nr:hypothetical protein [Nitriliruptorales bacterium]
MLRRKFASLGLVALLALAGVACNGEEADTEEPATDDTEADGLEETEEATDGLEETEEATEEAT